MLYIIREVLDILANLILTIGGMLTYVLWLQNKVSFENMVGIMLMTILAKIIYIQYDKNKEV